MKNLLNTLLEKLSENSTWRGIILIATAVGVKIEPELQESIIVAGLGLVGLINVNDVKENTIDHKFVY